MRDARAGATAAAPRPPARSAGAAAAALAALALGVRSALATFPLDDERNWRVNPRAGTAARSVPGIVSVATLER
jgi:hypothetical protein